MNELDISLEVFCVVSAVAKTGVEMEAIMGVNSALITIYDLSKIVNPHLKIDNVKLLIKEGGKSGLWKNPDGSPRFFKKYFLMKISVELFGAAREFSTKSHLDFELIENSSIKDLRNQMIEFIDMKF